MKRTKHKSRLELILAEADPSLDTAAIFRRAALFVPALARIITYTRNGARRYSFLPTGNEGFYGYHLPDGTRPSFASSEWHEPILDERQQNQLAGIIHDIFKFDGYVAYDDLPEELAIIIRPSSILTLGLSGPRRNFYYSSPEASGHDALEEAMRLEADFPGIFELGNLGIGPQHD